MKTTTFLQNAFIIAQESKCASWKVGVVIAKDDRIISTGYNGTPAGLQNCCDHCVEKGWAQRDKRGNIKLYKEHRMDHSEWSLRNEIHAEMNALLFAAKRGVSTDGATLYTTLAPCFNCAKAIAQSGIRNVVYCEDYDQNNSEWSKILVDSGIKITKIDKKHLPLLQWDKIRSEPEYI